MSINLQRTQTSAGQEAQVFNALPDLEEPQPARAHHDVDEVMRLRRARAV